VNSKDGELESRQTGLREIEQLKLKLRELEMRETEHRERDRREYERRELERIECERHEIERIELERLQQERREFEHREFERYELERLQFEQRKAEFREQAISGSQNKNCFPNHLKEWYDRALSQCRSDAAVSQMKNLLTPIIKDAITCGAIHTINWANRPVPVIEPVAPITEHRRPSHKKSNRHKHKKKT